MDNYSIIIPLFEIIVTFFTVGGIIFTGFLLGYIFVGLFIYDEVDDKEEEITEYEKQRIEEMKYINLYYDEFEQLENFKLDDETLMNLSNCVVEEMTPQGKILMTYNNKTESFWYWTDNKNINYRFLDTVARRFSLDYNCKQICINYKSELNTAYDKIMKKRINEVDLKDEREDNMILDKTDNTDNGKEIFARFKSYNVKRGNNDSNDSNDKQIKNKQYILAENANRFSYKGTIMDYDEFKNKPNNIECNNNDTKKIDFATFKKMILKIDNAKKIKTL